MTLVSGEWGGLRTKRDRGRAERGVGSGRWKCPLRLVLSLNPASPHQMSVVWLPFLSPARPGAPGSKVGVGAIGNAGVSGSHGFLNWVLEGYRAVRYADRCQYLYREFTRILFISPVKAANSTAFDRTLVCGGEEDGEFCFYFFFPIIERKYPDYKTATTKIKRRENIESKTSAEPHPATWVDTARSAFCFMRSPPADVS